MIAVAFLVVTFACFTIATGDTHMSEMGDFCETVMTLADNTIIQTGAVLLVVLAAAWLGAWTVIFPTQSELNLRLSNLCGPPLYRQILSREYSYLSQLFSLGIIHSKLHSVAV